MADTFDPDAYLNQPMEPIAPGERLQVGTNATPGKFNPDEYLGLEPADHGLSERQKLSPLGKALSPITGYWPTYKRMENEAFDQASEGVHEAFNPKESINPFTHPESHGLSEVATGLGKAAAGTAGYVFSPISAAYRSVIGQPIEDITGIPREYTEFAAQLATPYIGLTGPKAAPAPVAPPRPALPVNRFGVTESAGQASQDLPTIQAEQGAFRGQAGKQAQEHAQEFFNTQQPEQITEANRNVSKSLDVPGTAPGIQGQEIATKPTEAADIVQKGLQKEAARQKADVKALYDKAKSLPGSIDADTFRDMPITIREELNNAAEPVYVNESTPRAADMLRYLNDRIGELKIRNDAALSSPNPSAIQGVTLEGVEQWRKAMSNFRGDAIKAYGTNPTDYRASQAVMNAFDKKIAEAVNSGAFTGDPQAIQAFNDARAAHSARMKLWGNDAIGRRLQAIIGDPRFEKDPATLNDVVRWMYGESGSSNSLNVGTVKRIQKILGDQSPEWSAIKQGLFRQLIDKAGDVRGYKTVTNRMREFLNGKGSDLANAVYSPAERDMLNAYADMFDRLDVPQAGANWPNTAAGVIPHIKHMGQRITGAVGALIGHAIWPGVGGEVGGYVAGEQVGKALTKAEEARNYREVAKLLPVITQRFKVWQQAVQAQQRLHNAQTQARVTATATNLTDALSKLHGMHPDFAKMLTQGPSGPGTSNANETPPTRARGGKVEAEKALPADHQLGMRVPKGGSSCHSCYFFRAPTKCGNKGFVAWNHGSDEIPGLPDEYCCDNYKHTFKRAKGGKVKGVDYPDFDDDADSFADKMIEEAKHFADGGVPTADDAASTPTDDAQPLAPGQRLYVSPMGDSGAKGTQTTVDQPTAPPADTNDQGWLGSINDTAKRFTNYDRQFTEDVLNLPKYAYEHTQEMRDAVKNVLGINELQNKYREGMGIPQEETRERYQTWPERMIRSGGTLAHDVYTGEEPFYTTDPVSGEQVISPRVIERGLDMAGMAGTGGLANAEEGAVLNATPSLRPALKYQGKIYKAPPGGEHADAMPPALYQEYQKQALSGEDMSNFDFGFMNHKGQFLNREDALKYGIDNGLLDPHSARYGALTTPVLRSETDKPGAAVAGLSKSAEPFYSAAEQTVAASRNQKMQGVQWANWLKNQPGVKPDELQYTGVDNWLRSQNGPVTKQQVQEYLGQNRVQLNDILKGGDEFEFPIRDMDPGKRDRLFEAYADKEGLDPLRIAQKYEDGDTDTIRDLNNFITESQESGPTKYQDYQLPGGNNYREHLITLPTKAKPLDVQVRPMEGGRGWITYINGQRRGGIGNPAGRQLTEDEALAIARHSAQDTAVNYHDPENTYRSSHWDEPNILAHVRTNERDVGGVPSLHLEEIQSDWHQEGRKQGYANPVDPELEQQAKDIVKRVWDKRMGPEAVSDALLDKWVAEGKVTEAEAKTVHDYGQQWMKSKNGVPEAPFKTEWPVLALKRMIRQAAEEGKSRISWTPGEAQAARYGLSKHIKEIEVVAHEIDGKQVKSWWPKDNVDRSHGKIVTDLDGKVIQANQMWGDIVGKNIEDVVGKDVAKRGLEAKNSTRLTGADLKVGGEGMKGFYDQMLPKMVEKLGKQYGVKVKQGSAVGGQTLETPRQIWGILIEHDKTFQNDFPTIRDFVDYWNDMPDKERAELRSKAQQHTKVPVWYFDIPEKMKQDALTKGFALFSDTSPSAALLQSYDRDKKNTERPVKKEPAARAHGGRVVASLINHEPTPAQIKAGNYAKDHVSLFGLNITIENARGKERSGIGKDGKRWSVKMPAHYGYFKRTTGADKDHVDVYLGPHIKSKKVFVVNQVDANSMKFDETKVMLGFASLDQALNTYTKGFSDGKGKDRIGSIVPTTIDDLKDWLKGDTHHKPYRTPLTYGKVKYKGVTVDQQV